MNIIDKSIYENLNLLDPDLRGWHSDHPIFENLIGETRPSTIVEVGTWKGLSAINMARITQDIGLETKIYCIDTWLGGFQLWDDCKESKETDLLQKNGYPQIYYQFLSNVVHCNLQDIIVPFPNTSSIGYIYLSSNQIRPQLIYIDGSHDEDDVYLDLKYYYDLLKEGGIIFGDDYDWEGVKNAVINFCSDKNIEKEIIEDHFWIIKKLK